MSVFKQSSSSSSRRRVPIMQMATAFSLSFSSPPSSPVSDNMGVVCPLKTKSCEQRCGNEDFNIVDHLVREHRAKHYDAVFDEDGVADIQFETAIPLIETIARQTAVLLSLPSGEILCWSMETKRRGDGELQASSCIQIIYRPLPLLPPCDVSLTMSEVNKQTASTTSIHQDSISKKTRHSAKNSTSSPASSSSSSSTTKTTTAIPVETTAAHSCNASSFSSQHENRAEEYEILYHATISTEHCKDGEQHKSTLPQWTGVLSSTRSLLPHEYLVSHGGALVRLYPTNSESFVRSVRKQRDGTTEETLSIPISLRLQAISYPKND